MTPGYYYWVARLYMPNKLRFIHNSNGSWRKPTISEDIELGKFICKTNKWGNEPEIGE